MSKSTDIALGINKQSDDDDNDDDDDDARSPQSRLVSIRNRILISKVMTSCLSEFNM